MIPEIEETLCVLLVIETLRYNCCFCVDLCDLQMSIVKQFSVDSVTPELKNINKVEF